MTKKSSDDKPVSATRMRIGLGLWVFSYVPICFPILAYLHTQGKFTSEQSSSMFIAVFWGIQYLIGFIGLFLAGSQVIKLAQADGTKKLPGHVWRILKSGSVN